MRRVRNVVLAYRWYRKPFMSKRKSRWQSICFAVPYWRATGTLVFSEWTTTLEIAR